MTASSMSAPAIMRASRSTTSRATSSGPSSCRGSPSPCRPTARSSSSAAPRWRSISRPIPSRPTCSSSTRTIRRSTSSIARPAKCCRTSAASASNPVNSTRRMALRWTPRAMSMSTKTAAGGCTSSRSCSERRPRMGRGMLRGFVTAAAMLAATAALSRPFFDPRADKRDDADAAFAAEPRDPACYAAKLVSTGGLAPRHPHTLAVRWVGYSNFELAYNGKIILLDAYFDRGGNYPPLGFAARDVTRADVILIGHGHFDHMSDPASVGIRTGAVIVGAPVTTDKLAAQQVPATQILTVTGRGGELLKFDGFLVESILARHGQPDARVTTVMEGALGALSPEPGAARRRNGRSGRAAHLIPA